MQPEVFRRPPPSISWLVAEAANGRPATTVTPNAVRSAGSMPISRNCGLAAFSRSVPISTPVTPATPGTARIRARDRASIELLSRSATPFCAMVKSACPVLSSARSLVSRLWVTTPSDTTASTPVATARAVSASRSFFTVTLCSTSAANDTLPSLLNLGGHGRNGHNHRFHGEGRA